MDLVFFHCGIKGTDEGAVEDCGGEGKGNKEDGGDGADDRRCEATQAR